MLPFVTVSRPSSWEELMSSSFWWLQSNTIMDLGFSAVRADALHKKGLNRYRDIWSNGRFMTPTEIQDKYGLLPAELPVWSALVVCIYHTWDDLLRASSKRINCREWIAIFGEEDSLPLAVCRADEGFQPSTGYNTLRIPRKIQLFTVKQLSKTLEAILEDMSKFPIVWDERGDDTIQLCRGKVCRVRVLEMVKGPKKKSSWLYYGAISRLE